MGDTPFHLTRMGAKFFEATLPKLVSTISRLADRIDKLTGLLEEECAKGEGTPVSVFVVRYSHKHGNDVWARSTKDDAMSSIGNCMRYFADDELGHKDEIRLAVREAIEHKNVARAMSLWEANTDEYFEITETILDGRDTDAAEDAEAARHR